MNEHVQGIPQFNTNLHLLMKASTQQHLTQNHMHTPVEPQLHQVQFHSPIKPNTPERGEHSTPQPRKISPSLIEEHPLHSRIETYQDMQIIPPPTIQHKLFERKPLPDTLIWKQDKEFERWHNTYTAFIGQQHHL